MLVVPVCGDVAGVAPIEPTWWYGTGVVYLAAPFVHTAGDVPAIPSARMAGVVGPIVAFAGRELSEVLVIAPGYQVRCIDAQSLFSSWVGYELWRLPVTEARENLQLLICRFQQDTLLGSSTTLCPDDAVDSSPDGTARMEVRFSKREREMVVAFLERGLTALQDVDALTWDVGAVTPTPYLRTPTAGPLPRDKLRW